MTGLNIAYEEGEKRKFIQQQIVALSPNLRRVDFCRRSRSRPRSHSCRHRFPPVFRGAAHHTWLVALACAGCYDDGGRGDPVSLCPSLAAASVAVDQFEAALVTAVWILASAAFSCYVPQFGSYNAMYGSLGAVIVLLLWLWLSAFVLLIGATLNAETEHQTLHDTTIGAPKPMGERELMWPIQ